MNLDDKYIPIVLCAGFGTRLKPLTDFIPKVACPLKGKPFAFYNIEKFLRAGFSIVHCNIHYLPEIVKTELITACEYFGYDSNRIRFWHEEEILETGGGITRIYKDLCSENLKNKEKDLIVVSGDIVADFPLIEMLDRWENRNENEKALMCTKELETFRKDAAFVNPDLTYVVGFGEKFYLENATSNRVAQDIKAKLFSNHQIISGEIVLQCEVEKKSSIELFYQKIIRENDKIINFIYDNSLYWFNVGTPEEYLQCLKYFSTEKNILEINYTFFLPIQLKRRIDMNLNNCINSFDKNKNDRIVISFRENKNNNENVISLNCICGLSNPGSIYLMI